ncbi:hypothetical protein SCLCIDRAFT_1212590 [Scleroderma citrinum Foug A]|uniref:Uncharacterized protein n=1 Tax=Scleroderma citrinum Foug A TaxID=1036808 RepID=A0A0C3EAY5_9AGAM|nr:hypothetical protein SCLCIDRAFT_1212590 [Scleroderma citrinum Foug A]
MHMNIVPNIRLERNSRSVLANPFRHGGTFRFYGLLHGVPDSNLGYDALMGRNE